MEHWLQVRQYENMIIFNSIFSRSVGHVPKFSQRMQRYYLSCNDKVFAKVAIQEWIFLSNCIRAIYRTLNRQSVKFSQLFWSVNYVEVYWLAGKLVFRSET